MMVMDMTSIKVAILTYYTAVLRSSVVTVRVSGTEGNWIRPKRCLCAHLLLGDGAKVMYITHGKLLVDRFYTLC